MTTPQERTKLLHYGLPLGDSIKDIIGIVTYKTFQRWKREFDDPNYKTKKVGRPRIPETLRQLIIRLAVEHAWGYTRIKGELLKMSHCVGRSPIQRILKLEGVSDPYSRRLSMASIYSA